MKQRGTFSISTLILMNLRVRPATKTRLMQNLTLGYTRIQSYIEVLTRRGLIQLEQDGQTFSLTSKGSRVLELSEELASLVPPIEDMIRKYSFYQEHTTIEPSPVAPANSAGVSNTPDFSTALTF